MLRYRDELEQLRPYVTPPDPAPVKLDANESPWALPEEARALLGARLAEAPLHRYPDGRASVLRVALAKRLEANPDQLVLGSGSDEIIAMLLAALSRPNPTGLAATLYPTPTFVMYRHSALAHGHLPVEVPLGDDWSLDLDALRHAFDANAPNLAFYATPNNPTGNALDERVLRELVESYPNTLHVIDEAYGPFHRQEPDDLPHSLGTWADTYPNVAVMGTLSKMGLAGLRVGWLRCPLPVASEIEKVRQPFNLSRLSQIAATVALTELHDTIEEQVRSIVAAREELRLALEKRGLQPFPSRANFLLTDVRPLGNALEVAAKLRELGVAIRAFGLERLASYARITIGTPAEHNKLLAALDHLAP